MGLYVLRFQACSFCNSSQHFGADFFPIVEGPREFIGIAWIFKLLMRTTLAYARLFAPTYALQRTKDFLSARGGKFALEMFSCYDFFSFSGCEATRNSALQRTLQNIRSVNKQST
jgi:hypothetical protein